MDMTATQDMTHPGHPAAPVGDPAVKAGEFRRCLGQFATGVTVITAALDGELHGVTANSFSSVSLDPPLVLWSIGRTSRSYRAFEAADHFTVNILSESQIDLSRRFSSAADDKFGGVDWTLGGNGAPILRGVSAFLECRREQAHGGGDHLIHIGRVERIGNFDRNALVFVQGRYGVAVDHPESEPGMRALAAPNAGEPTGGRGLVLPLLFQAAHRIAAEFDRHHDAVGVTREQHRVLFGLEGRPGSTLKDLVEQTFLGDRMAQDAVASLLERGLVEMNPSGRLSLSQSGVALRRNLEDRVASFEESLFSTMPPATLASARHVLAHLGQ